MENLSDLASALQSLATDKATDRKKAADRLRSLLAKPSVIHILDQNSSERQQGGRKLVWNSVLKAVTSYIFLEADFLQKAKESTSASVQGNRDRKKRELSTVFKFVVKTANKNGVYLKSTLVLNHIIDVMKRDFTCMAFGTEYSIILLKNVLQVRRYRNGLPQKKWHELLVLYCQLFLDTACGVDRVVLARLLHELLVGASQQSDLQSKKLISFFTEVFRNIREMKTMQVLQHLVGSLNVLVDVIAPNSRIQICKLGESIIPALLYLWSNNPSDMLKDGIIQFFWTQMQAHHPSGALKCETGAFAADWDVWKGHMRKIHDLIIGDLDQLGGRHKFISGNRVIQVKVTFTELLANLCYQLYSEDNFVAEVTDQMETSEEDSRRPNKKRRLTSGWASLIDRVRESIDTPCLIPWLQLLTYLLDRYCHCLQLMDPVAVLQCLHQCLGICKRSDSFSYIFQCLSSLARSAASTKNEWETSILNTMNQLWCSVWTSCLSVVSSRQTDREQRQGYSFELMTTLLKSGLVQPCNQLWNLFLPDITTPSVYSLSFLISILCASPLPENYEPSILGTPICTEKESFSLRRHLLEWARQMLEPRLGRTQESSIIVFGDFLVQIMLHNPDDIPKYDVPMTEFCTALEKIYLQSTFDCGLTVEKAMKKPADWVDGKYHTIPSMVIAVANFLQKEIQNHLEFMEVKIIAMEFLSSCCALLGRCLAVSCACGIHMPVLKDILQQVLNRLLQLLGDYLNKEGIGGLLPVFQKLQTMVNFSSASRMASYQAAEIIRGCIPDKLIHLMFELVSNKLCRSTSDAASSSEHFDSKEALVYRTTSTDMFSSFDNDDSLEFGEDTSHREEEENLDVGWEEEIEASEKEDAHAQNSASLNILDPELLSESQALRNAILDFASQITRFDSRRAECDIKPSTFNVESVKRHIEEILSEDRFDPALPADIQMMATVSQTLLCEDQFVTDAELESIMDVLRRVAKVQHQDQQICCLVLNLLKAVAPYLSDQVHTSQACMGCRTLMLQLVSAFWRLREEGQCNSQVRLHLAQCMGVITQCDPDGKWGKLNLAGKEDNSYLDDEKEDTETAIVASKFPCCLVDGSLSVRFYMARAVEQLFVTTVNGQVALLEAVKQHQAFDTIYEISSDMMNVQGTLSAERQQDECWNRTASVLLTLSTVATTSLVCEKKAIFALCQIIQEKQVNTSQVLKIINKVARLLGYKDSKEYIVSHLPYLLEQWLELQYPLPSFPYQLLLYADVGSFYRNHVAELVPELYVRGSMNVICDIAEQCGESVETLLKSCLPGVLVHILPAFATSKCPDSGVSSSTQHINQATACYDKLVHYLGKEAIDKSIVNLLGDIVVRVLGCTKLEDHDEIRGNIPEPNPPFYSRNMVSATLEYITQSFSGNTKSLMAMLAKSSDGLERVMQQLNVKLWKEPRLHEQLRVLQMLQLLVGLVLKELAASKLGGSEAFVLRHIFTTLLHCLSPTHKLMHRVPVSIQDFGYMKQITLISLRLLELACSAALQCHLEEMTQFLPHIVDKVSNLAEETTEIQETAKRLLQYLIEENSSTLLDAISRLDPLPDSPVLADLCERIQHQTGKQNVQQVVGHVLQMARDPTILPRSFSRTLNSLWKTIDSNRMQLLDELKGSCSLSSLVCALVRLTHSSCDAIRDEAAQCLSALGPVSLADGCLFSPQPSPGLTKALEIFGNGAEAQYCYIFYKLLQYLFDTSVDVVQTTSGVLKRVLATPTGHKFSTDFKEKMGDQDDLFRYLHPFRCIRQPKAPSRPAQNLQKFSETVDTEALWVADHEDHETWLTKLCTVLLQSGAVTNEVLVLLQPICEVKVEFCEMLLPYLVHDILATGFPEPRIQQILSSHVAAFFHKHLMLMTDAKKRGRQQKAICFNTDSVRVMLNVVKYLRLQSRPSCRQKNMTAWDNNFWLNVDYSDVAYAAHTCGAYFSAVLFVEIWCDALRMKDREDVSSPVTDGHWQPLTSSQEGWLDCNETGGFHKVRSDVQSLLLEAVRCIGDPDAMYGCGAGYLPDPTSRIETYLHEKKWDKALVTLDIKMQQPTPATQLAVMKVVDKLGADYVFQAWLQGASAAAGSAELQEIQELKYQAAWRAGQWDLPLLCSIKQTSCFHKSIYTCLHAVRDGQINMAQDLLNTCRRGLIEGFDVQMESCQTLYPLLSQLKCLHELDRLLSSLHNDNDVNLLLADWAQQITGQPHQEQEFEVTELVHALWLSAMRLLVTTQTQSTNRNVLQDLLLQMARGARVAGNYQIAERHLQEIAQQQEKTLFMELSMQLEFGHLFWVREEHETAKFIIRSLINTCQQLSKEKTEAAKMLPAALGMYGSWLADTHSETPSIIMKHYLEKTVQLLEEGKEDMGQEAVESYLTLARFADAQYQNIVSYVHSATFEAKQALMKKASEEFEKYKSDGQPHDRYLRTLQKQNKIDQEEVCAMVADRQQFLVCAAKNYARCLQRGDTHDLRIFRLTSLWFDNSSCSDVTHIMEECSERVKSYKFLPLLHQLAARMSTKVKDNTSFFATLNKILEKAAKDHPHHTLWVLMALAHAEKDQQLQQGVRTSKRCGRLTAGQQEPLGQEDRVKAAQTLLDQLRTQGDKLAAMVWSVENLSIAYIELANLPVDQNRKETKPVSFPKSLRLVTLKNLTNIAVPSLEVPVDSSCAYDKTVTIRGFLPTFHVAGGVNQPKIITCQCSDGVDRRQLVKGRDDLRQDAVMQQVFRLVNQLLSQHSDTQNRRLHIRTYKVIPLSRRSGLLEWCEGTQPLGDYLIGSTATPTSGAHFRYRPKDWSALDCRKCLMAVQNSADPQKKYAEYMRACRNFHPVFRFFFMETFSDPIVWFQRRLAYTRSVATNSIVGYILGLGDRHVMNILIDRSTAELIHIDFGVAFEQGQILPTPETVPFRLTRDVVDGMGVTGVEGVFRRSCEKTMEVMRGHQESLLTIVQVLLYDPLSEWSLSPHRAYALQARSCRDDDTPDLNTMDITTEIEENDKSEKSEEQVNKLAERVLLRLQQKLQGMEDRVALSVKGQVNHLIQTAQDPRNLARLFHGWQPYI